jgi:hypothetical protein
MGPHPENKKLANTLQADGHFLSDNWRNGSKYPRYFSIPTSPKANGGQGDDAIKTDMRN